jgi:molybdopterin molybdotransferase
MITVAEAKEIIEHNVLALPPKKIALQLADGKILAEDIYAMMDIPAFPQSSVDGYAFLLSEWVGNKNLIVEGESEAGRTEPVNVGTGKAIRIFTGAPVPPGTDTVVMQEKVQVQNGGLLIEDTLIQQGMNVRPKGSEIKKGSLALKMNSLLSPAAIGFLAGIGIKEVKVFPHPVISIIVTGKELQQPGKSLGYGQVYESNSFTLTAALQNLHINNIKCFYADDDLQILTGILKEALQQTDMVLLTGGISAGDYDFVLKAAENCGVTKLFHTIKQRPGKPLYFGKKEDKLVFGLPGNPSSVLTCFYEYVLLAWAMLTKQNQPIKIIEAPLSMPFYKTVQLTVFLKGWYNGHTVAILDAQESYRLSSFATANCLVKMEEDILECKAGQMVEVHLLPV